LYLSQLTTTENFIKMCCRIKQEDILISKYLKKYFEQDKLFPFIKLRKDQRDYNFGFQDTDFYINGIGRTILLNCNWEPGDRLQNTYVKEIIILQDLETISVKLGVMYWDKGNQF
jgi:hypothetical protein